MNSHPTYEETCVVINLLSYWTWAHTWLREKGAAGELRKKFLTIGSTYAIQPDSAFLDWYLQDCAGGLKSVEATILLQKLPSMSLDSQVKDKSMVLPSYVGCTYSSLACRIFLLNLPHTHHHSQSKYVVPNTRKQQMTIVADYVDFSAKSPYSKLSSAALSMCKNLVLTCNARSCNPLVLYVSQSGEVHQ